jgi:hypothetical protein
MGDISARGGRLLEGGQACPESGRKKGKAAPSEQRRGRNSHPASPAARTIHERSRQKLEKTPDVSSLYLVFGTVADDDLSLAAIRFWGRNLSPFGLACFARRLRYRGSTHPASVVAPAALPALKSRFVNNPAQGSPRDLSSEGRRGSQFPRLETVHKIDDF